VGPACAAKQPFACQLHARRLFRRPMSFPALLLSNDMFDKLGPSLNENYTTFRNLSFENYVSLVALYKINCNKKTRHNYGVFQKYQIAFT
jgi:hypothetical protein